MIVISSNVRQRGFSFLNGGVSLVDYEASSKVGFNDQTVNIECAMDAFYPRHMQVNRSSLARHPYFQRYRQLFLTGLVAHDASILPDAGPEDMTNMVIEIAHIRYLVITGDCPLQ